MLRASVLIPTHEHAATLPFAVASVQAQCSNDVEILIVGDGVDDAMRAAVARLQAEDSRIRFFDFPKGPSKGEVHRDVVLRQARGRIVCYQCDDDLWLPGHLQDLEQALEAADFAGSMHADVSPEGRVRGYFFDFERPEFRESWLEWRPNRHGEWASDGFGLSFAAHRLDAYLRLPDGWSTTAPGYPTDQTMFMKFVREPWCRIRALSWPVALHFPDAERRGWSDRRRTQELSRWTKALASPDGNAQIFRQVFRTLGDTLLQQSMVDAATRHSERAALQTVEAERNALLVERGRLMAERDALVAERNVLVAQRNALKVERGMLVVELDALVAERNIFVAERNALKVERGMLMGERDALVAERNTLVAEGNALEVERGMLTAERDALLAARDALLVERNALIAERNMLVAEGDALVAERNTLSVERDRLLAERETLTDERDALADERGALLAELGALAARRGALLAELGTVYNSTSWHLTAPMRALVDRLRRLRGHS
jgi:hypothetical protein